MILCLCDHNPSQEELDHYLAACAESGRVMAFKELYSSDAAIHTLEPLGITVGTEHDCYPLDRTALAQEVTAAADIRQSQSVATGDDAICYTPGYVLAHPVDTLKLLVNSVIENGDHYLRTLVGGSLGYYTMDLAWGWVVALYLLLAWAALPAAGELLPAGRTRAVLRPCGGRVPDLDPHQLHQSVRAAGALLSAGAAGDPGRRCSPRAAGGRRQAGRSRSGLCVLSGKCRRAAEHHAGCDCAVMRGGQP